MGQRNQTQPPDIPEFGWYVIHTRSRHEAKVEGALGRLGLENFLPRMTIPSQRRDRKRLLEVALFPGYLFVHTDLQHQVYHDIVKIPGAVRILKGMNRFAPIPEETMDAIRALVASPRPYYPWPYLKKGSRVRIIDGPLAGTLGFYLRRQAKKRRLVVSIELLNRSVAVELDDDAVEPWP